MRKYRYINHTADVEFIAYGKTLEELFSNSAQALFDTIAEANSMRCATALKIAVHADSEEELLWRFLQKLLSIGDARCIFFYSADAKIKRNGMLSLSSVAHYCKATAEKAKLEAKGISKYALKVSHSNGIYSATVVVDV